MLERNLQYLFFPGLYHLEPLVSLVTPYSTSDTPEALKKVVLLRSCIQVCLHFKIQFCFKRFVSDTTLKPTPYPNTIAEVRTYASDVVGGQYVSSSAFAHMASDGVPANCIASAEWHALVALINIFESKMKVSDNTEIMLSWWKDPNHGTATI